MDSFQYDLAQKFSTRALEQEPDCVRALELNGILSLEAGHLDEAKNVSCYVRAKQQQLI